MSKASQNLLEVVQNACPDHLSPEQLLAACQKAGIQISQATLYRNLKILEKDGKVHRISLPGKDVYDGCLEAHAHLVCPSCQKIEDLPGLPLDFLKEKTGGKEILGFDLLVYSLCEDCRTAEKNSQCDKIK